MQIVEWYDELDRLTDNPVVRLNRAVAVGEADGARAGLAALAQSRSDGSPATRRSRPTCASAPESSTSAAELYAAAARAATNLAERDHLTRQAARLRSVLRG